MNDPNDSLALKTITIPQARTKLLLLLLLSAGFVGVGSLMIANPEPTLFIRSSGAVTLFGSLGVAMGALGLGIFGTRFLTPKPILRLDSKGIENRSNRASLPYLAWADVSDARIVQTPPDSQALVLDAFAPERLIECCPSSIRRAAIRKNLEHGFGISTVDASFLPSPYDDLQRLRSTILKRIELVQDAEGGTGGA